MIGPGDNISPVMAPGAQAPPSHTIGMSQTFSGTEQLPRSQDMSQTRKLSLDPHVRLKVEKLEDVSLRGMFSQACPASVKFVLDLC